MEDKEEGVVVKRLDLTPVQQAQLPQGHSVHNIEIRFDDGFEGGRPVSRIYSFGVVKPEGASSTLILRRHLEKCLIMLDKHGMAQNKALQSLESDLKSGG